MNANEIKMIRNLLKAQNGFVALYPAVAQNLGNLNAAVFYTALISSFLHWAETDQLTTNGWFFFGIDDMEYQTTLPAKTQQRVCKALSEKGLIEVSYRGLPKRRFFKLNTSPAVLDQVFGDNRKKPEKKPLPDSVKERFCQPFNLDIFFKQIDKAARSLEGIQGDAEGLKMLAESFFERLGYPVTFYSQNAVQGLLIRYHELNKKYSIDEFADDLIDEFATVKPAAGHSLGLENFLTDEFLEILERRIM